MTDNNKPDNSSPENAFQERQQNEQAAPQDQQTVIRAPRVWTLDRIEAAIGSIA